MKKIVIIFFIIVLILFFFPKSSSYGIQAPYPGIKFPKCLGIEVIKDVMIGSTHAICFGWVYKSASFDRSNFVQFDISN